jgi:predicted O-methyltransferase YrrM
VEPSGTVGDVELGAEEIEREFVATFLEGHAALEAYRRELAASGLVPHLEEQAAEFWSTVRGETAHARRYNTGRATGRAGYEEGLYLYAVVRELEPLVAVETGVCNGVSTAFLLLALERNGAGTLHSIDLPEFAGRDYQPDAFWEGKGGAVVPAGKEPGWMVPDELRGRWHLEIGRSQELLRPVLAELGTIDFFLHDSEHSYECMSFELRAAYAALRPGGILAADDFNWNEAFTELARDHGRRPVVIGPKMALLVK